MWPKGNPGVEYRLIERFPGYAIGSDGSVWSRWSRSGQRIEGWRRSSIYRRPYGARYCVICLRVGSGKKAKIVCRYVHRLVLLAFSGPPPTAKHRVLHGDNDTRNNRLSNLRWGTQKENMADKIRHGTFSSKLTSEQVAEIRCGGVTDAVFAARFKCHETTVKKARLGKTWVHHPTPPLKYRRGVLDWLKEQAAGGEDGRPQHAGT